jgi:hypothetical protein
MFFFADLIIWKIKIELCWLEWPTNLEDMIHYYLKTQFLITFIRVTHFNFTLFKKKKKIS